MNWTSWAEFWHMGGYGLYVWGSYAVTAVLMGAEAWTTRRRLQDAQRQVGMEQSQ